MPFLIQTTWKNGPFSSELSKHRAFQKGMCLCASHILQASISHFSTAMFAAPPQILTTTLIQSKCCIFPDTRFHWFKNRKIMHWFFFALSVVGDELKIYCHAYSERPWSLDSKSTWVYHTHNDSRCAIAILVRSNFSVCKSISQSHSCIYSVTRFHWFKNLLSLVSRVGKHKKQRFARCCLWPRLLSWRWCCLCRWWCYCVVVFLLCLVCMNNLSMLYLFSAPPVLFLLFFFS